jgi:hypothetical protein
VIDPEGVQCKSEGQRPGVNDAIAPHKALKGRNTEISNNKTQMPNKQIADFGLWIAEFSLLEPACAFQNKSPPRIDPEGVKAKAKGNALGFILQ